MMVKRKRFVVRLLQRTAVLHQLLYHFPVHERLAAEEVNLQIVTVSGIGYQEIQCLLTNLKAHKGTTAMVLAFLCETVFAAQVTVMRDVQAQRLDYGLSL